jgi:hypothetical protein
MPVKTLPVLAAVCTLLMTLAWLDTWAPVRVASATEPLPTVGQFRELHGIRVALLQVERLGGRDLETPHGRAPAGVRIIWWVENRPGERLAPVLGEVRVVVEGRQYNAVTNATSRKPFAPDMLIHDAPEFLDRSGRVIAGRAPRPRPQAVSAVLEVYVRGGPIPTGAAGSVEIELGRMTPTGTASYEWFRFQLPRLDD